MKLLLGLILIAAGCASRPDAVPVSKTAGPEAAITAQHEMIEQAQRNHVHVLAPEAFKNSQKLLSDAEKQKDDKDIYESLGVSKAYLNEANSIASARNLDLQEVLDARGEALEAGADSSALKSADNDLKEFTNDADDYQDMKRGDKEKITAKYLRAELDAIKTSKLATIKSTLEVAKSKGAAKLVPKTYRTAMMRYRAAEKAIETDRHAEALYQPAVSAAAASANRTLNLVETAAATQNQTPEQRAITLDARNKALMQADELNAEVTEEVLQRDEALAAQTATLNTVSNERNELKDKETQDQAVASAAAKFNDSEADVYRQGENLVIRLKQVNFASGRSELPSQSMTVLGKVKNVLQELSPSAVMIEGHTDAVGNATTNQKLSEQRAASVAKFFASDASLAGKKFETAGFGYSKPLTSNKTAEGRAQNRRVDIVITPNTQL